MLRNLPFKHEIASLILTTWTIICEQVLIFQSMLFCCRSLAALAALYLTLVSDWVGHCHFRILTQRVTFETWDPSDIWPEWCQKRQKEKKKKRRQKNKTKNGKTKRQKYKRQKDKRQRPKREFIILTSGQFRTLSMFFQWQQQARIVLVQILISRV